MELPVLRLSLFGALSHVTYWSLCHVNLFLLRAVYLLVCSDLVLKKHIYSLVQLLLAASQFRKLIIQ